MFDMPYLLHTVFDMPYLLHTVFDMSYLQHTVIFNLLLILCCKNVSYVCFEYAIM